MVTLVVACEVEVVGGGGRSSECAGGLEGQWWVGGRCGERWWSVLVRDGAGLKLFKSGSELINSGIEVFSVGVVPIDECLKGIDG